MMESLWWKLDPNIQLNCILCTFLLWPIYGWSDDEIAVMKDWSKYSIKLHFVYFLTVTNISMKWWWNRCDESLLQIFIEIAFCVLSYRAQYRWSDDEIAVMKASSKYSIKRHFVYFLTVHNIDKVMMKSMWWKWNGLITISWERVTFVITILILTPPPFHTTPPYRGIADAEIMNTEGSLFLNLDWVGL